MTKKLIISDIKIMRNAHFFYKKHRFKKYRAILPKTVRKFLGYPLKPKET